MEVFHERRYFAVLFFIVIRSGGDPWLKSRYFTICRTQYRDAGEDIADYLLVVGGSSSTGVQKNTRQDGDCWVFVMYFNLTGWVHCGLSKAYIWIKGSLVNLQWFVFVINICILVSMKLLKEKSLLWSADVGGNAEPCKSLGVFPCDCLSIIYCSRIAYNKQYQSLWFYKWIWCSILLHWTCSFMNIIIADSMQTRHLAQKDEYT